MVLPEVDGSDLARIRAICRRLPEVEESELQGRPLFRVHRRRFAIYNGTFAPARPRWDGSGRSIHLLTDPLERPALRADPRFSTSPHHGDRGWVAFGLERGDVDWIEVAELIEAGYRQAAPSRLAALADTRAGAAKGDAPSAGPAPIDADRRGR